MTKTQTLAPNAKAIVRNLLLLKDGTVLAGYRIGPVRWDFTGRDPKLDAIHSSADVYSHLTGRVMLERVSTRPHPIQAWAAALDRRTAGRELPDVHVCEVGAFSEGDLMRGLCGCETWMSHLRRMQDRIAEAGMDDKVTFRYFSVGTVGARVDLHKHVQHYITTGEVRDAIKDVIADEKRVHDIVRGWRGSRRMSEVEQAWLRVRTMAPGQQPPTVTGGNLGWDTDALPMLSSDTRWSETPFGRTVKVTSFLGGKQVVTHSRVLVLARLADLNYPDNGLAPWQVLSESCRDASGAPFSVEWSIVGHLLGGEALSRVAELELKKAQYVMRDYAAFHETPPAIVANAIHVANDSRDQITTGQGMESARFLGQIRVIISGDSPEQVEERCASFVRHYGAGFLRMDFTGPDPASQADYLRSAVPGEHFDTVGYQRRLRLPYLAAGMPTVSNTVGDGKGPYLGYTRGASRRPVMHDPQYATEGKVTGRGQNFHLVIGTLGAGKSVLKGSIAYNCTRRGIRTIISDPSGPLARLASLPELAAHSQVVDLAHSRPGVLNPASLIREPLPEDFIGEPEGTWAMAVKQAQAERRDLVVDSALRCMPDDLYSNARTRHVLREAARLHVEGGGVWSTGSTMWDLVRELNFQAENGEVHAATVAGALVDASTAPLLSLLFAHRDSVEGRIDGFANYDKTLTIITMPGVTRAPDDMPRRDWNPREIGADAVLRLVALFTERLIYTKTRSERCAVFFDEAEMLTDSGPGRSALSRLGRDHSKWNTAVYLGVKSINQQMLSGELKNFLASIFVGRMASVEPAREVLGLLGLDLKYANTLMHLSEAQPGEFVHLDVDGLVGSMKVDVDYHLPLKEALLTDPTPEGSEDWINAEEVA